MDVAAWLQPVGRSYDFFGPGYDRLLRLPFGDAVRLDLNPGRIRRTRPVREGKGLSRSGLAHLAGLRCQGGWNQHLVSAVHRDAGSLLVVFRWPKKALR